MKTAETVRRLSGRVRTYRRSSQLWREKTEYSKYTKQQKGGEIDAVTTEEEAATEEENQNAKRTDLE